MLWEIASLIVIAFLLYKLKQSRDIINGFDDVEPNGPHDGGYPITAVVGIVIGQFEHTYCFANVEVVDFPDQIHDKLISLIGNIPTNEEPEYTITDGNSYVGTFYIKNAEALTIIRQRLFAAGYFEENEYSDSPTSTFTAAVKCGDGSEKYTTPRIKEIPMSNIFLATTLMRGLYPAIGDSVRDRVLIENDVVMLDLMDLDEGELLLARLIQSTPTIRRMYDKLSEEN